MTKTNRILTAVLATLLLILAAIGGVIAWQSGLFSSRDNLSEPFYGTRYSGTINEGPGLIDDPVPVVLIIRFHDDGNTAELTSPSLKRYSRLTRTDGHTYREEIVHGEGDSGTEWTFSPGEYETMDISYTTPDGESSSAKLPRTAPENNSGEIGLNPNAPDSGPDGIEFGSDGVRELATIEWTHDNDPDASTTETAIFRASLEKDTFTVTYPERGCYGVLEFVDEFTRAEKFSVGDCEDGGRWLFIDGDPAAGEADYTSPDGSITGKLHYQSTEWIDIDGEIGVSRSGPVLDFYHEFTGAAAYASPIDEADEEADEENAPQEETRALGSCDSAAIEAAEGGWSSHAIVTYCDGEWARAATYATDDMRGFHFVDGTWKQVEAHGNQVISGYPCYDDDRLRAEGAPEDFIQQMTKCF